MTHKKQRQQAAQTHSILGAHVGDLTDMALDVGQYNQHGHAHGAQGEKGHLMPPSDAHKQDGAYLPQNMYTSGSGREQQADNADTQDYGTVDKFDD